MTRNKYCCYYYNYAPSRNTLKKHKILNRLKRNKNIVIVKPDKGNGVVILDRNKYNENILKLISDQSKFKKLTSDVTKQREEQLKKFLRRLKNKNFFTDAEYYKIYPKGSQPALIYGLPKIHKSYPKGSYPPFRPIVSSIGTYNYNLSKYLCSLLTPILPTQHCTKDSFTFEKEITQVSLSNTFFSFI